MSSLGRVRHAIEFAWIELTNRCNLQCSHCYSQSGPDTGHNDLMTQSDYESLLSQLSELECRQVQFIGGEPTLNKGLVPLIKRAHELGFEFIEVYTNLVTLRPDVLQAFADYNVSVATSVYSADQDTHNRVTDSPIAFQKTIANIKRCLEAGLSVRAGFIEMETNEGHYWDTVTMLQDVGVKNIGHDRAREFGRANKEETPSMKELCGSCAGNILSIGPDGVVAPCNMSRDWPVGSVLDTSLIDIVRSRELVDTRVAIRDAVGPVDDQASHIKMICTPKTCNPYDSCCPSTQSCLPCAPNGCIPCRPKG